MNDLNITKGLGGGFQRGDYPGLDRKPSRLLRYSRHAGALFIVIIGIGNAAEARLEALPLITEHEAARDAAVVGIDHFAFKEHADGFCGLHFQSVVVPFQVGSGLQFERPLSSRFDDGDGQISSSCGSGGQNKLGGTGGPICNIDSVNPERRAGLADVHQRKFDGDPLARVALWRMNIADDQAWSIGRNEYGTSEGDLPCCVAVGTNQKKNLECRDADQKTRKALKPQRVVRDSFVRSPLVNVSLGAAVGGILCLGMWRLWGRQ